MKKLFALLMSFQLILTPVAFAEDPSYGTSNLPGTEEASTNVGLTDAYKKTGTGSSGGYDFYVNQISVLATSAIGSSIITQCMEGLKTPSIATFMAGSLVQIMSEILGAKAKNDRNKKKMKDLKIEQDKLTKEGSTGQKEILEQALQEEKDTLKFLTNRKKWMTAVTAIYTAAMGLAIAEEVYGLASGWSTGTAACAANAAECTLGYAACMAGCEAGIAAVIAQGKATMSLPEARETWASFCAAWTPILAGCEVFAQTYLNLVYGSCLMLPSDGGASMLSWSGLLSLAYGFGMGKVGASAGPVAQYGSMLISLMPLITTSFSKLVVQMYNFPIPRSITFGASAVFTGTVTAGLAKREQISEFNVNKLKNVIADFKITSGNESEAGLDLGDDGVDSGSGNDPKTKKNSDVKKLATGERKTCFSKGKSGFESNASSCSNPVRVSKANLKGFNFPSMNKVSSLSSDLANALASGDENGAANLAGEIGSYAARVKAEVAKLQEQYNDKMKKDKKQGVDFDKAIKAQVGSMQQNVAQTAAKNNIDIGAAGAAAIGDDEPVKDEVPTVNTLAATVAPAVEPAADFSLGLDSTTTEEVPAAVAGKAEQSLDDFESTAEDISKKPDVSIFKQLSYRYILNYTKIFEKKKTLDAAPEAAAESEKK